MELWDKDLLTDDSMGFIEIPMSKLVDGPFEEWINVQPSKKNDKVSGQVRVECKFIDMQNTSPMQKEIDEQSKCKKNFSRKTY